MSGVAASAEAGVCRKPRAQHAVVALADVEDAPTGNPVVEEFLEGDGRITAEGSGWAAVQERRLAQHDVDPARGSLDLEPGASLS